MLKETKTEEILGFIISFLSLVTFQLRGPATWLRLRMIAPTNHFIACGPRQFGDFCNIFASTMGKDQKKF